MPYTFKKLCFGLVASGLVISAVHAGDKVLTTEEAEKLMSDKGYICLSCHKVDTQLIGPSYQAIATKYKGQEGIEATLIESVKKGSNGKWKDEGIAAPMPPNGNVSDEDADALIKWVLSLAPAEAKEAADKAEPAKEEATEKQEEKKETAE